MSQANAIHLVAVLGLLASCADDDSAAGRITHVAVDCDNYANDGCSLGASFCSATSGSGMPDGQRQYIGRLVLTASSCRIDCIYNPRGGGVDDPPTGDEEIFSLPCPSDATCESDVVKKMRFFNEHCGWKLHCIGRGGVVDRLCVEPQTGTP